MAAPHGSPRTLAYYLPQFHSIPENDSWWGDGFTEWTNVRKASPQFDGHDHPRVPLGLGYYDLAEPHLVMPEQVRAAQDCGVDGFCFYTYWFDGQRLLESPVDWFSRSSLDFPFCVSWANESWTRRWDGKENEVLMPQTYAQGFARKVFEDFLPYFGHSSYIRVNGEPVFLVHRADQIPNSRGVAAEWKRLAKEAGFPGLHLIATETKWGLGPESMGFDAVAEFPPVGSNTLSNAWNKPLQNLPKDFTGRLLSYPRLVRRFTTRKNASFVRYHGVAPGWDNTARRRNGATIYVGSSPEGYRRWLTFAREQEAAERGSAGLVFINAWNEWAEGAYLEPDATWGNQYAIATKWGAQALDTPPVTLPRGHWSRSQIMSAVRLAMGSVLALVRHIRRAAKRN